MAYKPKPNFYGSNFYLHDWVMVIKTGRTGIISGFDYESKTPKHLVTFNLYQNDRYTKSFSDSELKLMKRDDKVLDGLKRYELMTNEGH